MNERRGQPRLFREWAALKLNLQTCANARPRAFVRMIYMNGLEGRATAPFNVFYRKATSEGGFGCETCGTRQHGVYLRASDAIAVATQHLNLCRGALRHRPIEGTAIIDGETFGAVLREGLMIVALPTVFAAAPRPIRVVV